MRRAASSSSPSLSSALRLNRIAECNRSSDTPIARSTGDGKSEPLEHADPVEQATPARSRFIKSDYARARIPMLPVVAGEQSAKRQSVAYAAATAVVSVVPFFTGSAGAIYLAGAIVLGLGLVGMTVLDLHGRRWTRKLFAYSLVYVGALFGLFAISPFLG